MIAFLSILLFLVFTALGLIHFYWLFGGTWGLSNVIPTKNKQQVLPAIPKMATLSVALILMFFGLMYLKKSGLIHLEYPIALPNYIYWIIPALFILRAIGDFKYVGFFKKIKDTKFAIADSKLFSPLRLVIGLFGVLIRLLEK